MRQQDDFGDGVCCGAFIMAVILIPVAAFIGWLAYSSLRDEATSVGVAHWIVDAKTGVTKFEFIPPTLEVKP